MPEKDLAKSPFTPFGNTLTEQMAEAAINGEKIPVKAPIRDFLTVSFSSTDYIGAFIWSRFMGSKWMTCLPRHGTWKVARFSMPKLVRASTQYSYRRSRSGHVPFYKAARKLPGGSFSTTWFHRYECKAYCKIWQRRYNHRHVQLPGCA